MFGFLRIKCERILINCFCKNIKDFSGKQKPLPYVFFVHHLLLLNDRDISCKFRGFIVHDKWVCKYESVGAPETLYFSLYSNCLPRKQTHMLLLKFDFSSDGWAIYLWLKLYFQGIASFIALSAEYNICVAVSEKILRNSKTEDFDRIIERLSSKHNARGVIIFVDEDNIR